MDEKAISVLIAQGEALKEDSNAVCKRPSESGTSKYHIDVYRHWLNTCIRFIRDEHPELDSLLVRNEHPNDTPEYIAPLIESILLVLYAVQKPGPPPIHGQVP